MTFIVRKTNHEDIFKNHFRRSQARNSEELSDQETVKVELFCSCKVPYSL